MKDDILASAADIQQCKQAGDDLMKLCGDSERPEVQKQIDDLDSQFQAIESHLAEKQRSLDETMRKAKDHQDGLMVGIFSKITAVFIQSHTRLIAYRILEKSALLSKKFPPIFQ